MKKNIIAIFTCVVLLSACAPNNNTNSNLNASSNDVTSTLNEGTGNTVAMGRYIEEDTSFPSMEVIKLMKTENGFEIFGKNASKLEWYKSIDGSTWNKQEAPWIDELNKQDLWIRDISYDKNKNIYISTMGDNGLIKKVESDNTIKDVDIKWKNNFNYVHSIYILDNGDFLILDVGEGAVRYDKDGNFIIDYVAQAYYDTVPSAIFENKLALNDDVEGAIKVYNIDTGEIENTISYKGLWEDSSQFAFGKDGSLYIQNRLGIYRVVPNGSKLEELVDGSMTSLSMPSMTGTQFLTDNNEFWVSFNNKQVKHYVYSETTPSKPSNEVSIYMLNRNEAMQQLAGEYQKSHPETKVTCEVGIVEGLTTSDIIRTLNTELLAGKGPDLILLDNLPIDSYIEKGVLMDMKDIDISQLNSIAANTYRIDNKLYAIPLYFNLPIMLGSNDIVNSVKNLDDLVNLKNSHSDRNLYKSANYSDLIKAFYLTSAPYWLEGKTINDDKFKQFLKNIKDLQIIDEEIEAQYEERIKNSDSESLEYFNRVGGFKSKNSMLDFAYNDFDLYFEKLDSPSSIMMPFAAIDKKGDSSFDSGIGQAEGVFEPSSILGINANSPNKDTAKEIMELAISETVQDANLYGVGFCINKNSLDKSLTDKHGSISSSQRDTGRELSGQWPEDKYVNKLKEIINNLKTPSISNETLLQIILDETKGYFEDTKTLDEVVEAVSQRTKAYFTE